MNNYFFWIFFAALTLLSLRGAATSVRTALTRGGWRAVMLGAAIRDTVSEQELETRVMSASTALKVHVLEPTNPSKGPHIGVEVVRSSATGGSSSGFGLTREEARALAEHLSVAVMESHVKTHA
jgi:hypothetical protein